MDVAHNAPGFLTGYRPTAAELRDMHPITRAMYGYGNNILSGTVNAIKGAFPDWEGLAGRKRQYAIEREKSGELPASPEPNPVLSRGKGIVNTLAGIAGGAVHGKHLAKRWESRQLVDNIAKAFNTNPKEFEVALQNSPDLLNKVKQLAATKDRGALHNFVRRLK